ncbi:ABC transporter I family member 10, chloroplastic [Tanacetum coccineum]
MWDSSRFVFHVPHFESRYLIHLYSILDIILAGLLSPTDGFMYVRKPRSFVFQNPDHQVVMPTVEADVAFGLGRFNLSNDETKLRVAKALTAVGMYDYLQTTSLPHVSLNVGPGLSTSYPISLPLPPGLSFHWAWTSGLDPTRKQTSLLLSERPLGASLSKVC